MHDAVLANVDQSQVIIMAAAVSDFRPAHPVERKLKKEEAAAVVQLERTDDILLKLGGSKGERILIGFAAETNDVTKNAGEKLRKKNLDLIVANDLFRAGAGFAGDTNSVTLIDRSGATIELPVLPKSRIAEHIIDASLRLLKR
jgi:phosphopantothenoylcysteine decarboxylase/phosphopantothenate--cysteine ligase